MLTYRQRKMRCPRGAQARVAEFFKVDASKVTLVMKGRARDRAIETALAELFVPVTGVEEAFGPAPVTLDKHALAAQGRRAVIGVAE